MAFNINYAGSGVEEVGGSGILDDDHRTTWRSRVVITRP